MRKSILILTLAAAVVLTGSSGWSQEEVSLPAKETVLVVVDMQNDFAAPGGLFTTDRAMKVVDKVKTVVEKARKANVPIIYTQDYHKTTDWELRAGGRKPHVMEGTWGAEILEVMKPGKEDYVVKKDSFDPWYSNDQLADMLF